MKFAVAFAILSSIQGVLGLLQSKPLSEGRRLSDMISRETMQEFKARNVLKDDFDPTPCDIDESLEWVEIDHELIPLKMNELNPIDVFAPNARYIFDGKAQDSLPASSVYTSDVDPAVSVSMTSEGLQCVTKVNPGTGDVTSVLPIQPHSEVFVEVHTEDINEVELGKHEYTEPIHPPSHFRHRKASESGQYDSSSHRELQGCGGNFRVIELAVAYDSTFCRDVGGTEELANNAVQRIVSTVSQIYQQPGLCLKVQVAAIDGFCNPATDIYSSIINFSVGGIASEFSRIITNDPVRSNIPRDTFHLFYGGKPGLGSIGFAYLDVLCDSSFGFGVNEVTYSTNPALQANLVAHELGHNAGSNHDSVGGQNVMSSVICDCPTFSGSSVNQINSHLNTVTCITPEGPTVPTSPAPNQAPTRTQIPITPRPTRAPTTPRPSRAPATDRPIGIPTTAAPTTPEPRSPTNSCVCPETPTRAPTNRPRTVGLPTAIPSPSPSTGSNTILAATFDDSEEGFVYVSGAFFGVDSNAHRYNSGSFDPNGGESSDGALTISLGGVDNTPIYGVSGGWSIDFVLDRGGVTQLSIAYQIELGANNESGEYALAVTTVDGELYGTNGNYYLSFVNGDGNGGPAIVGPYTMVQLNLPMLRAGSHTLEIGAYLQGKNRAKEYARMRIDSVQLSYLDSQAII